MQWLFLFTRRSSLLMIIALLVVFFVTAGLGNWQGRRAQEKRTLAELRDNTLAGAGIEIRAAPLEPQSIDGLKGRVSGRFVPSGTIYLDNRTHKGQAGFYVLTPLLPEAGGPALLILRGWIARDLQDRSRLPAVETSDKVVSIDGLLVARLPQSLQLDAASPPKQSEKLWQYFDLERYAAWFGQPIHPYVMRQFSVSDDRLVREWIHPADAVDKHRAYALQWYSMAAGIALFGLVAAFRVVKGNSTKNRLKEIV